MKICFKKQGFTLIETVFALLIISMGFLSVFSLVQDSIRATNSSINRLIAANLAQEGVEIIRNIRDSVYAEGDEWDTIVDDNHLNQYECLVTAKNCRVEANANYRNQLLDLNDGAFLKIDSITNQYNYSSGDDSIFKRWINLNQGGGICSQIATSTDCIKIDIIISWQERGNDQELEVEDYLYNWY